MCAEREIVGREYELSHTLSKLFKIFLDSLVVIHIHEHSQYCAYCCFVCL